MIVRVNVVLNRTVVVDSDWRFDKLCSGEAEGDYRTGCRNGSHCQQQQSYSGLRSPGRSYSTYLWNDSRVQNFQNVISYYLINFQMRQLILIQDGCVPLVDERCIWVSVSYLKGNYDIIDLLPLILD